MTVTHENRSNDNGQQARRRDAMAVLAHSDAVEIAARLRTIAAPPHENLREPEKGRVLVRGRLGGA